MNVTHLVCAAFFLIASGFACLGFIIGFGQCNREKQAQMASLDDLVARAKNAAGKLRVEMKRGTCEQKAEYDLLIDAAEKHRWR